MNPALALQQAVRAELIANAPLIALLGGAHVFDEVPRGEPPSYVAFDMIETRDWDVKDSRGHEHFLTISIQTNERGRKLAQEIADAIELALHDRPLTLAGHRLINLRMIFWTIARDRTSKNFGGSLRFRAATEPL